MPNDIVHGDKFVFLVDDDPAVLRCLQRLLKVHGFSAQAFSSAEAFCASANFDEGLCLVLDIDLPGMSGIELSRRLAASGSTLPVIFITGNDAEPVRKNAIEAGCLAYLSKPFPAQLLLDAIDHAPTFPKRRSQ
jgi:FixJ family two-component response regulator